MGLAGGPGCRELVWQEQRDGRGHRELRSSELVGADLVQPWRPQERVGVSAGGPGRRCDGTNLELARILPEALLDGTSGPRWWQREQQGGRSSHPGRTMAAASGGTTAEGGDS